MEETRTASGASSFRAKFVEKKDHQLFCDFGWHSPVAVEILEGRYAAHWRRAETTTRDRGKV